LALTVIYLSIYRIGRTSVEEKLAAWREPKSEADVAHVRANSNSACRGIPLPRVLAVPAAGCDTRRYPAGSRSTSEGLRSLASCRVASQQHWRACSSLFSGCIALERFGSGLFCALPLSCTIASLHRCAVVHAGVRAIRAWADFAPAVVRSDRTAVLHSRKRPQCVLVRACVSVCVRVCACQV
jgi:hypothetical protein